MTALASITTGRVAAPRRLLLYGIHGVGKSTFAASAPSPIFIQTEDGLGEIDAAKFPLAESFADVIDAMTHLYTSDHDHKTIAIDSLDWLERLIFANVCRDEQVDSIEEIGYAKGYVFALRYWEQMLAGLTALRRDRGMTVVLIAHARIERFENPETDAYDRYVPRVHKHASAVLCEWSDEVFFAGYRVFVKATDAGFDRTRTQGLGTGERILKTTERPSHIAKNRLNLPDELPLNWEAYSQFINPTPKEKPNA